MLLIIHDVEIQLDHEGVVCTTMTLSRPVPVLYSLPSPTLLPTTPLSQTTTHVSRLLRYKWSSKPANHEFVFQPYF